MFMKSQNNAVLEGQYPNLLDHWAVCTSLLLKSSIDYDTGESGQRCKTLFDLGSVCGSDGRPVAFDARGPRLESSHRQTLILDNYLFTVNCIKKTKIKNKKAGMAHF